MELRLKHQAEGFGIPQRSLQISGYTPTREEIERYWEESDPLGYQAYRDGYNQGLMEGMLEILEWVQKQDWSHYKNYFSRALKPASLLWTADEI